MIPVSSGRAFWIECGKQLIGIAALVTVWQIAVSVLPIPPLTLPSPVSVFAAFFHEPQGYLLDAIATVQWGLLGFLIGTVSAVGLGIVASEFRSAARTLSSIVVFLEATPKVVLAPILILTIGVGIDSGRTTMAALFVVYPVFMTTQNALSKRDTDVEFEFASYGMGPLRRLLYIRLPNAFSKIAGGIRIASLLWMVGSVVFEYIQAQNGLGYQVLQHYDLVGHESETFVYVFLMFILSYSAFLIVSLLAVLVRHRLRLPGDHIPAH